VRARRHGGIGFAQVGEIRVGLQDAPRARFKLALAIALVTPHGAIGKNAVVHAPQGIEVVLVGELRDLRPIVLRQVAREAIDRLAVGVGLRFVEVRRQPCRGSGANQHDGHADSYPSNDSHKFPPGKEL
jgi:hypothetical protein